MENSITHLEKQVGLSLVLLLMLTLISTSCRDNKAAPFSPVSSTNYCLIAMGYDLSPSFKGYRKLDTTYVSALCNEVAENGGMIVMYWIGETTDQSGLRCYLKPIPKMDRDLVLSKQAELRRRINLIKQDNNKQIREFLKKVQAQIFTIDIDPKKKICNTDINGFFRKADMLLDEPESQSMIRFVFAYSDGIQSIKGKDTPARYQFKTNRKFTLCLAGWKTKLPCDSIETKRFEDPEGFLQFIKTIKTINN